MPLRCSVHMPDILVTFPACLNCSEKRLTRLLRSPMKSSNSSHQNLQKRVCARNNSYYRKVRSANPRFLLSRELCALILSMKKVTSISFNLHPKDGGWRTFPVTSRKYQVDLIWRPWKKWNCYYLIK